MVARPAVGEVGQGPVVEAVSLGSGAGGEFLPGPFGSFLARASAWTFPARVVIWWSRATAST